MPLIPAACSPCADAPVVQLYALQGFSRPANLGIWLTSLLQQMHCERRHSQTLGKLVAQAYAL